MSVYAYKLHAVDVNIFPGLKKLKVPTLIIHGNSDLVPEWTADELHAALQSSKLVKIPNGGHFSYIEGKAVFFAEIEQFISSLATNTPTD